jgi:pyruvate/2-oxoglutarate dehydrogenase complex dihydrolipoamide dehydrogenase (E3) component
MVTTATRTGELAAQNLVLGNSIPYEGTLMTFVIEVFGRQIGSVGLTEKVAREKGLDVDSITMSIPTTRPRYGGKLCHYKLIANRKTHTLVGAQITSEDRIRGIINEMAIAIATKVPLSRLATIETPYSPAVGMDPLGVGVGRLVAKLG